MGMFSHDEVWRSAVANPVKPRKPHIYFSNGLWKCRVRIAYGEFALGTGPTIKDAVEQANNIYLRRSHE